MKMILLGPPGAGKGTLAKHVAATLNIPHISTGEMLRAAVKRGGSTAEEADQLMRKGQLLPDALILRIVKERLSQHDCDGGFILDGVPRTVAQAEGLEAIGVAIEKAVLLMVTDEVVIQRMAARRVCARCGAGYNLDSMPPKKEGVCDVCGGPVIARADDSPETIADRLKIYHHETEPVIDFYRRREALLPIVADSTPQKTLDALRAALAFAAEPSSVRMPR
ncbi:adenylate kinase family protein [Oscillospiraceae bacterium LTW-04]|nr:nucleoside monophosphate kinase [Oscillospiraceae bacterium MB24-C1]